MTNAERFIGDEDLIDTFIEEMSGYLFDNLGNYTGTWDNIERTMVGFFQEGVEPTLTEDERVILRNINGYTTIIRNIENNIQVENNDGSFACLCALNHLFQFIKLRRRI